VEWIVIRRLTPDLPLPPPRIVDPRLVMVDDFAQAAALFHALGRVDDDDLRAIVRAVREAGRARDPLGALQSTLERSPLAGRFSPQAVDRTRAVVAGIAPDSPSPEEPTP
jgi:hypothetical protein